GRIEAEADARETAVEVLGIRHQELSYAITAGDIERSLTQVRVGVVRQVQRGHIRGIDVIVVTHAIEVDHIDITRRRYRTVAGRDMSGRRGDREISAAVNRQPFESNGRERVRNVQGLLLAQEIGAGLVDIDPHQLPAVAVVTALRHVQPAVVEREAADRGGRALHRVGRNDVLGFGIEDVDLVVTAGDVGQRAVIAEYDLPAVGARKFQRIALVVYSDGLQQEGL